MINKTAKIKTFAKAKILSKTDFDNFNFSDDVKSAYYSSYNKTISLVKANPIQFMKKNNIKLNNNSDLIKLKKNVNELKYKVFDKSINGKQTIVEKVKITKNKKINAEVTKVLNNLIIGLVSASEKLTNLTTDLGITAGFFGALFIALAPFTAGVTAIPAFILSGVATFVISVVAGVSANINSMIQGIQTISNSMINENTSNAVADLPLNLKNK